MQNYVVRLESPVSRSFRCQKAADSLDIDSQKKSIHELRIKGDIETPFNLGLIVGASGSGKTTLAQKLYPNHREPTIDESKPIVDQLPKKWSYDECAEALAGIGLTSVPCWIRPVATLSNGQKARAQAVLALGSEARITVMDEFTSVVDRTVAKVMAHCVQKYARKTKKAIVLVSCHYDIVEWLNPDWIIDCNQQKFIDRRGEMVGAFERTDRLRLDIRECNRKTWPYFSKYHYLNDRLPTGRIFTFGLFEGLTQIGFQCFAAYIIGNHHTFFSNRTVIHPDYCGLGLGIVLIDKTSHVMVDRGYKVKAKFTSTPVYRSMCKHPNWRLTKINRQIKKTRVGRGHNIDSTRVNTLRRQITTYHFDYKPKSAES